MDTPLDPEFTAIFSNEMQANLPRIRELVRAHLDAPGDLTSLAEAYRLTHTLHNSSAWLGHDALANLALQLETMLSEVIEAARPLDPEEAAALFDGLDVIERGVSLPVEPEPLPLECGLLDAVPPIEPATAIDPFPFDDLPPLPTDEADFGAEIAPFLVVPEPPLNPELDSSILSGSAFPELAESSNFADLDPGMAFALPEFDAPVAPPEFSVAPRLPQPDDFEPTELPPPPLAPEATRLAPELLEVFLLEAEDHLRALSEYLPVLRSEPENRDCIQQIRRRVHTLKGTAAMVGFKQLTQLTHRSEDLLDRIYDGDRQVTPEVVRLLFRTFDAIEDLARGRGAEVLPELYAQYDAMLGDDETPAERGDSQTLTTPRIEEDVDPSEALRSMQTGQFLRVPIERLDELVKLVSELAINRAEFEQRLSTLGRHLSELRLTTSRLRRSSTRLETEYEARALGGRPLDNSAPPRDNQANRGTPSEPATYRTHGFDALEFDRYTDFHLLTRDLAETGSDLQSIGQELAHLQGEFDGHLSRQTRLTSDLQDKLMRVRMVPLASLASRLSRTVRHVANGQGKEVRFVLDGQNAELDKTVLEEMVDPFGHLLRNAVDHGIEFPHERIATGKPLEGTIRVKSFSQGTQVVIQITDDGRGIDPARIREAAINRGTLTSTEAAALSDADAVQLIFRPGFSSALEVSEISGRGVGLDVVASQVHRLKGTLSVESKPGQGTTFTVRLPLTLAVLKSLMVKVNGQPFAIPLGSVRQIHRLDPSDSGTLGDREIVRVGGAIYPKLSLAKALRMRDAGRADDPRAPVVILDVGDRSVALTVDELLGGREIVVKSLGNHLRRVHGIVGATLLGDGSIALIVNPAELGRAGESPRERVAPERPGIATRTRGESTAPRILVVDDSPSVRRIVATLLKNIGWTSTTAKDGLEALELLQSSEQMPDAIMLDVEMPRMDGYEFLATIRAHPTFRDLPTVMVTSRAGDKHRRKAMELGASAYLVKPYQETELIQTLRDLMARARRIATEREPTTNRENR